MRMHPILHVCKLHDGTDFHADCGTPVYAAANGRVISEYYNAGYGNRIILDHGFVKGVSLQTSYNHLTSFVAASRPASCTRGRADRVLRHDRLLDGLPPALHGLRQRQHRRPDELVVATP